MGPDDCSFCRQLADREPPLAESGLAVALPEQHPHAEGHTVVITRRHAGRLTQLTDAEYRELFETGRQVLDRLERTHTPDAFTLGVNDGPAAGQSTPHVHLHIVPRNAGDVDDPRGGIRRALPDPLKR